jgi:hypothetical protein
VRGGGAEVGGEAAAASEDSIRGLDVCDQSGLGLTFLLSLLLLLCSPFSQPLPVLFGQPGGWGRVASGWVGWGGGDGCLDGVLVREGLGGKVRCIAASVSEGGGEGGSGGTLLTLYDFCPPRVSHLIGLHITVFDIVKFVTLNFSASFEGR